MDKRYYKINATSKLGNFFHDDKMYIDAIKMYDKAIKIDPKYADAYISKGSNINIIIVNRKFA